MPLHDWSRVGAGVFHDFHLAWIAEIRRALNRGLLPDGYYALAEQVTTGGNPDVLALHEPGANGNGHSSDQFPSGGVGLLTAPPATRLVAHALAAKYANLQRQIAVRHKSGDRVIALIEIISPGNKSSDYPWDTFLDKMLGAIEQGIHLLILDPHPPSPRDPGGVHGSLWGRLTGEDYTIPADADRTLAAYTGRPDLTGYVEPVAVWQELRAMPLFLTPEGEGYIEVPLEATYTAAYEGVPARYRRELEAPISEAL